MRDDFSSETQLDRLTPDGGQETLTMPDSVGEYKLILKST